MRSAPRTLATLLAAVLVLGVPAAAWASEGSIPPDVRAFVTGGGLLDELDDVYGTNAAGDGIEFDETTTPGPIMRVFHFTDERLAGDTGGKPTRMVNEWAVPVSVAEQPVGVALVWINPDHERPELAELQIDADAAVALAEVPEASRLVRDLASGAWFALADDTLTPLVAGASGILEPVPVDEAQLREPQTEMPDAPDETEGGILVAVIVVVVLIGVVVGALLLPGRSPAAPAEEAAPDVDGDEDDSAEDADENDPEDAPERV